MSEAVVIAVIAALPPTFAVLWAQRSINAVVNASHTKALETIRSLEAEIRQLRDGA